MTALTSASASRVAGAARATAEGVLSRKPKDARALFVRGRCLESSNENERAIATYRAALEAEPGHLGSLQRLWRLYEAGNQINDAISSLETLTQINQATGEEQFELARLYGETGLNASRGLRLLESAQKAGAKMDGADAIRRKLESHAAHETHGGGGGDNGVTIIKGR